ncbi:MAG: hypothetical protein AAF654_01400 [Myxococcota bacterium]
MQITVDALDALGAVDYDQDGSVTTADYERARADLRVLDTHAPGTDPFIDRRDARSLGYALAPVSPAQPGLRQASHAACVRLRSGATALEAAGSWRASSGIDRTCTMIETVLENTPLGPYPQGTDGTHWIQEADLERALEIGRVSNPYEWGTVATVFPVLGALESAVRSAPDGSAIATSARVWSQFVSDAPPDDPLESIAHTFLRQLEDAGATVYVSRQPQAVFPDQAGFRRAITEVYGDPEAVELAGRLYLAWPQSGPEQIRVELGNGMQVVVSRNASVRLMRLSNGILVVDSIRGIQGNWKTGWASLQAAVFSDERAEPWGAVRANVLRAGVNESGILLPWGSFEPVPAPDQSVESQLDSAHYSLLQELSGPLLRLP